MKINKNLIGWVVAAAFAAGFAGVLIYNATTGDGGTSASSQAQASAERGSLLGGPPDDASAIMEEKNRAGEKGKVPNLPPAAQEHRVGNEVSRDCGLDLPPTIVADWANEPASLDAAAGMAQQILAGMVTGLDTGQPYRAESSVEPRGAVEMPTQNITIRVDQSAKGGGRAGQTVTVERLGDAQGCFRVQGEPPYRRGQQVVLFLEAGGSGRPPHPIAPAGRFVVGPANALEAVEGNPVAAEVAGKKLEEVLAKVRGR
jgi:hypothetical protein